MSWIVDAIIRGLGQMTQADIDALPPATRMRLADLLRHWSRLADKADEPKSGVLKDLKDRNGEW